VYMLSAFVDIRVRYQETDQMGVVYHANYFTWFESARIELLDQLGWPYREMEEAGYLLPVLGCEASFIKPAQFDDRLQVRAFIRKHISARIEISYEVNRLETLLALGKTTHAFVDKKGKLIRPPKTFVDLVNTKD